MPGLKEYRKYDDNKRIALKTYFKELSANGSFYKDVIQNKSNDYLIDYNNLHTWFNNKYEELEFDLKNSSTQDEIDEIQLQMLAYSKLLKKTEMEYKKEYNIFINSFSKKGSEFNKNVVDNFKLYDSAFNEFENSINFFNKSTPENNIKGIDDFDKEQVENARKAKADQIREQVEKKVAIIKKDYSTAVEPKVKILEDYVNKKFVSTVKVDSDFVKSAKSHAKRLEEENEKSLNDFIDYYQDSLIDAQKKAVDDKFVELKDKFGVLEKDVFDKEKEVTEIKDDPKKDLYKDLYQCNIESMSRANEFVKHQMIAYMAAKQTRENRWLITKVFNAIFRPQREKEEKAKIQQLRNNLKESLHADDAYMDNLDKFVEGKIEDSEIGKIEANITMKKVDYSIKLNEKLEEIDSAEMQKGLKEATNTLNVSNKEDYQKDINKNIELNQDKKIDNQNLKVE